MAFVLAVQHWRPHLLGRKFGVYSNQKSLKHLLQQRITKVDQQNWIAKLLGYQFEVVYKPGTENKKGDSLSRMFDKGELKSIIAFPIWLQVQQEVGEDEELRKVIEGIKSYRMPTSVSVCIKGYCSTKTGCFGFQISLYTSCTAEILLYSNRGVILAS